MEVKDYDAHVAHARALLGVLVVGEASAPLHVGHLYRAALHLAWYEKPFSDQIPGKLNAAGFKDVVVYDDANTLPPAFGDLKDARNATHWGEAVWNGAEGATPQLPSQVLRVRDDGGPGGTDPVTPPSPGGIDWWTESARIKAAEDLAAQILDRVKTGTEHERSLAKQAADELAKAVQAARDMARDAKSSAEKAWQRVLDTLIKARDLAGGVVKAGLALSGGTLLLLLGGVLLYRELSGRARGVARDKYMEYQRAKSGG
jgi:hypothetical protein